MRRTPIAVVVAAASALVLGMGHAMASSAWSIVPSPNVGSLSNGFGSVSALSPTEAWAVGTRQVQGSDFRTLAEHWNGSTWTVARTPNGGTLDRLNGVGELAQNDVWAVGNDYDQSAGAYRTLVEHFDGTSWSIVPSPNGGSRFDSLQAVAATGPDDVWAVGVTQTSGTTIRNLTLTEHYDGTAWRIVPSPSPAGETDAWLLGVAAVSSGDVWAVGFDHLGTLAEHWNGTAWSIVPTPNASGFSELTSTTAIGSNDVWAVGESQRPGFASRTLAEHFDGTSWSVVPSPNIGTQNNMLFGVTNLGPSDVWSVGVWVKPLPEGGFVNQTLTERWDGSAWRVVASPNVGGDDNVLLGTSAPGGSTVFAVGGFTNPSQRTLVLENAQA